MKKLFYNSSIFYVCIMAPLAGVAETISVPPPKAAVSVPAEAVSPGKELSDLSVQSPAVVKKADCKDLNITPAKPSLLTKEAKVLNFTINKPLCLKGVLTTDSWISVSKIDTGISVFVEENTTEETRKTEIVLAGIDKGVSLEIVQSSLAMEIPPAKKENPPKQVLKTKP